jgi:PAS domain S-box-containing protein
MYQDEILRGWLVGDFALRSMLDSRLESVARGYWTEISDPQRLVYTTDSLEPRQGKEWDQTVPLALFGLAWNVAVRPTPELLRQLTSPVPWAVLVVGLIIASLLSWAVASAMKARAHATQLEQVNRSLQSEIAERQKAEIRLQEKTKSYRDLFENANDLIQSVTVDGRFLYTNPQWQKTMGFDSNDLQERTIFDLLHPRSHPSWNRMVERIQSGSLEEGIEAEFVTRRGECLLLEGSCSCKVESGRPTSIRTIFRDMTRRRQLEQMKDELIGIVSHELRTPLAAIQGSLALIVNGVAGPVAAKARDLAGVALRNSERLTRLINDILNLEKLNAGALQFRVQTVELMPLVEHALEVNRAYAAQWNVRLKLIAAKIIPT